MITTPYMAAIIAHEDMNIYAYVSIVEVLLKLGIAILLQVILWDKLKLYALLLCVVTFASTFIYRTICRIRYQECRFKFSWDKKLLQEIMSYTAWNLFGEISNVAKNQGVSILLNIFFGPIVNAGRAIAIQINSVIINFVNNFLQATQPQIVKDYAEKRIPVMLLLVFRAVKMTFFLMMLFVLPIQLELSFVLDIWLKQVPEYALIFTRILLINTIINSMGYPLTHASYATGKIKTYQIVVGGTLILNLPLALIILGIGFPATSVIILELTISVIAFFLRILIMSKQLKFSILDYFKEVIRPIFFSFVMGSIVPIVFTIIYPPGALRFLLVVIISSISMLASIYLVGFSRNERSGVVFEIKRRISSLKKNRRS
jgi:O-antigen/teichoic acid export membrane protein